jgi:protein required for attachment to host cells
MSKLSIPHLGMVFVGDGRKALFLRNEGDEKFPNLKVERVLTQDNPPTREQGSDKPGRTLKSAGSSHRSSMEPTDWHDLEEHRFAREVAGALETAVRDNEVKALVVVAPARTLADLRRALHASVKDKIVAEIDKDLTKHPVYEIERHVVG